MMKKNKFKIEPFKHPVKLDPEYKERTWKFMESAIAKINNLEASGLSFEELYRTAYNMVVNKFGDSLYQGIIATMKRYLEGVAAQIVGLQGEAFLREIKSRWDHHNLSMQMIRDICMYMDRIYVKHHNLVPVQQLQLDLWRDQVTRQPEIHSRMLNTILDDIRRERHGEVINKFLIRATTQMLMDLGPRVYQDDFEEAFLERASEFYKAEAAEWIGQFNCPEYLQHAEQRLQEEKDRVASYLDVSTEQKIIQVLEHELIATHMQKLADMPDSGLVALLENTKVEDLKRMYSLFRRVEGGLQLMRDILGEHLKRVGKALVNDPEKIKEPVEFVTALLGVKGKYDSIIMDAFGQDKTFQNTLNTAFEYFVNLNQRTPEYISLFMDDKLRKGMKGATDEDVEASLEKIVLLFRYLSEKDVFEKYYKQHLSKRLLSGRAIADEAEHSVLSKLKSECGHQFTSKLESMFTDIKTSRDMMLNYRTFLERHQAAAASSSDAPQADLSVQVLTTGSWPGETAQICTLPREVETACQSFQEFYAKSYSGRKLTWQTNKGHADVKANFPLKKHELSMSTHQMCVCLLFNESDSLSYRDIQETTRIPDSELKRILQSLACVKGRNVLRKEPIGREVNPSDMFHYNDQFQNKLVKLKIGTIMASRETEPEKAETRQKVEEDRKPLIEAAIVRIMKARRRLDHNSIVTEVSQQLSSRFLPSPAVIKKRIENLIEREFLQRDEEDRRFYTYVT